MKTLMKAAAANGGGTNAVRDRLVTKIRTFGHDVHYLRVVHETGNWAYGHLVKRSCLVNIASNGYKIAVYMNN